MKLADDLTPTDPSGHRAAAGYVLVVDDEPALRQFAARVLDEEGFLTREAKDGAEALELLNADGALVDVVVSDIVMPRLNGVQLLEMLAVTHPGLPVVLMSGFGSSQLTERGIAAPCAILTKPFPADRLVGEVRRCIRPRA